MPPNTEWLQAAQQNYTPLGVARVLRRMRRFVTAVLKTAIGISVITGCGVSRNPTLEVADPPFSADAVVTFGTGSAQEMFFVRSAPRISVGGAAFGLIPLDSSGRIVAYGARDQAAAPLLWIMRAQSRSAPSISVHALPVSAQIAPPHVVSSTVAAASFEESCKSGSWIAAFFVEGIGSPPTGPVILYYVTGGKGHQLEVKPERHTLRGDIALRLQPADLGGLTWVSPIEYQAAGSSPASLPTLARRDERGWRVDGGVSPWRRFGWSEFRGMHSPRPIINEWRLYQLSLPPGCEHWYGLQ